MAEEGKKSCAETAGPMQARIYVEHCLLTSPATHPPCNAANSCELIVSEIRRSCAYIRRSDERRGTGTTPAFCRDYE